MGLPHPLSRIMAMTRAERFARVVVVTIIIGLPAAIFFYQALAARAPTPREIFIVARTVERGGWSPARIVVKRGETVRLRILAEDATHGFQLLHFGVDAGAIKTGTIKSIEFNADRAGEFPFYCSVRCSPLRSEEH